MSGARNGFSRAGVSRWYLIVVVAFVVSSPEALGSSGPTFQTDREKARLAWEEALRLRQELSSAPNASRDAYFRCIKAYRNVYYLDPHFQAADDAIFESGNLCREMGEKYRDSTSLREAARLFQFLLTDYPSSKYCQDARRRLHELEALSAAVPTSEKRVAGKDQDVSAVPAVQVRTDSRQAEAQKGRSPGLPAGAGDPAVVRGIRYWSTPELTRVSIDVDRAVSFSDSRISDPERLFFDLPETILSPDLVNKTIEVGDSFLQRVRMAQNRRNVLRIVFDLSGKYDCSITQLRDPSRIMLEVRRGRTLGTTALSPSRESLSRALDVSAGRPRQPDQAAVQTPPSGVPQASTTQPPPSANVEPGSKPLPKQEPDRFTSVKVPDSSQLGSSYLAAASPVPKTETALPTVPKSGSPFGPPLSTEKNGKPVSADIILPTVAHPENVVLPKPAAPTSKGDRTLARVLGLKIGRIVIDPGHGGHDLGTVGPDGLVEKDLVLQVARILRKLLEENLGAEVFLTRDEDVFISLEERTATANQHQADLFISIHANSSSNKGTSGVETYFLDFARSAAEREVAARENAATVHAYRDLEGLVRKIARADKMAESRELASTVQKNLYGGARQMFPSTRNRGVRSAPFIVLIGAKMPSVLAEVAFLSNPRDEKLLKRGSTQQRLARALFQGIEVYMKALGSEVAQTPSNSAP
jgi:N-acetylmuramoyl-L-alanine amidase